MLANTLVGYAAAWGRAVFFADNLLVNAGFIAVGVWLRDLLVLVASGTGGKELAVQLGVWSPLLALSTAVTGMRVPGDLPRLARHPARGMNEFHSYRRAERAAWARWFFLAAFLVLVVAFFRTQVVQHERFQLRAEKNRLRIVPLVAPRGVIYDRNGLVIAENVPGYAIKLLAPSADSLRAVLARFRTVVPLDSSDVEGIMARYRQAQYQPVAGASGTARSRRSPASRSIGRCCRDWSSSRSRGASIPRGRRWRTWWGMSAK